jgi:hypothetical protein
VSGVASRRSSAPRDRSPAGRAIAGKPAVSARRRSVTGCWKAMLKKAPGEK